MDENIYYYTFYAIAFFSAVLYSVLYKRNDLPSKYKYFVLFLVLMFTLDFSSNVIVEIKDRFDFEYSNLPIYALLTLIEFNLLFLFYNQISEDRVTKELIKYFSILFNLVFIASTSYYIYQSYFLTKYNYYASISGSILIGIILLMFLREFLISNKILNYKRNLSFWITFGLLLYYLASIPGSLLLGYLKFDTPEEKALAIENHTEIQFYVTLFMHGCFIFGAFWSRKNIK